MKNKKENMIFNVINNMTIYDEICDEARAIIESSRILSGDNEDLFRAHIKYFTDSPVILREINRILKINQAMK